MTKTRRVAKAPEASAQPVDLQAELAALRRENARLASDLASCQNELTDALEQQSATAEVLRVISRSPVDASAVFQILADSLSRLCRADIVTLWRLDGDDLVLLGRSGQTTVVPTGQSIPLCRGQPSGLAVLEAQTVHIENLAEDQTPEFADWRSLELARPSVPDLTRLAVPLLRDGVAVGVIVTIRDAPSPFTEPEVKLVETFADQAVIAIENARLFEELQLRSRELEAKTAELEMVSRHKSEFLANMSHELRTPLNGIIGFSEILLDPDMPVDDATRDQFLTNILASGKHQLALINDILDLSKVESGKMELHPEWFDLAEAIQGVHAVVKALVDKKQQRLRLDIARDIGSIEHDPARFKQVLFNLLSNAVKFTPNGGSITTSVELQAATEPNVGAGHGSAPMSNVNPTDVVTIAVADTGIGIAPANHERVFAEFQQIDSGYARTQQGTGLGLALTRNFVRLMGGDITLTSAIGAGSTFTVRLPRIQPPTVTTPRDSHHQPES